VNTSVGNEWKTAILGMIIGRGLREKIVVSKGRRAEKGGEGRDRDVQDAMVTDVKDDEMRGRVRGMGV